ncbi:hypothetical protein yruck0001_5860 [Yersinia ruckeri ATCC 29473]|nr:hypothetical protein yruck0001_5860 [Yersinia ruckeri ATCC 29473]
MSWLTEKYHSNIGMKRGRKIIGGLIPFRIAPKNQTPTSLRR